MPVDNTPARMGAAAVKLRVSGASYDDIAMTLGLASARTALTLVTRELADTADEMGEDRDQLRRIEADRLDSLLVPMMVKATDPDHPEHIPATKTAVTLIDRRIRLFGLDAPTEVTIHTPTQTELDNWVSQMVGQSMPPQALQEPDIIDVDSSEDVA